jgi:hypothetical protein
LSILFFDSFQSLSLEMSEQGFWINTRESAAIQRRKPSSQASHFSYDPLCGEKETQNTPGSPQLRMKICMKEAEPFMTLPLFCGIKILFALETLLGGASRP